MFEGKILEVRKSKVNGKLTVVKDLVWGIHIKNNLTQSGGIAKKIWQQTLQELKISVADRLAIKNYKIKNCLILGLGGGSIATIVRNLWPNSKITGVDIDPVIVGLGKKHLDLDTQKVNIIFSDAFDFINNQSSSMKYDLICIDTYQGDIYPKKFESEKFLLNTRKHLSKKGKAIFNRLYYSDKRKEALEFEKTLNKIFPKKVERFFPEANIMFICS